jgi:hypothetical protein
MLPEQRKENLAVKTIEIRGVWLIKSTAYYGNRIEVLIELADGTHHIAITDIADDGPISQYVHPSGIVASPIRTFEGDDDDDDE